MRAAAVWNEYSRRRPPGVAAPGIHRFGEMSAALYARVTTRAVQDPTMQLRELRELCERRQWEVAGTFTDRPRHSVRVGERRRRHLHAERLAGSGYSQQSPNSNGS